MIGLFDSGIGGISVLNSFHNKLSKYSYIYYADSFNSPYGNKKREEIYKFSKIAIELLFLKGASLVIVACNTVSASVLRELQDNYFNNKYPNNKVLGIIIPNVENIIELGIKNSLGIIGTNQTIKTNKYSLELRLRKHRIKTISKATPYFAEIVENHKFEINKYLPNIREEMSFFDNKNISHLLLACTHYSFIKNEIKKSLLKKVTIIDSSDVVVNKTIIYLKSHPELKIKKEQKTVLYTSGNLKKFTKNINSLLESDKKRNIKILKSPIFSND